MNKITTPYNLCQDLRSIFFAREVDIGNNLRAFFIRPSQDSINVYFCFHQLISEHLRSLRPLYEGNNEN